jgi:hypothetical protein
LRGGEWVIINPTDDVREGVKVRPKTVAEHVAAPGASSPSRSPNREPDSHAPLP